MTCPVCGGPSRIVDSRKKKMTVKRRRECINDNCQYRFTTIEVAEDDYEALIDIWKGDNR